MTKINQKFSSFTSLGDYVKSSKKEILENAAIKLKNENIFVENLSTLNKEQIKSMLSDCQHEHLDYLFHNRNNIVFKELQIISNRLFYSDSLELIYNIEVPYINDSLSLKVSFDILNVGLPRDLEIEISDIYLKDSFKESNVINNYSETDLNIIQFYNDLFGDVIRVKHLLTHYLKQKSNLIISDVLQYSRYYYFSLNEKSPVKIYLRLKRRSFTTTTFDKEFSKKLKDFIETEYTLPVICKKIDDMTEEDITVFKMLDI